MTQYMKEDQYWTTWVGNLETHKRWRITNNWQSYIRMCISGSCVLLNVYEREAPQVQHTNIWVMWGKEAIPQTQNSSRPAMKHLIHCCQQTVSASTEWMVHSVCGQMFCQSQNFWPFVGIQHKAVGAVMPSREEMSKQNFLAIKLWDVHDVYMLSTTWWHHDWSARFERGPWKGKAM